MLNSQTSTLTARTGGALPAESGNSVVVKQYRRKPDVFDDPNFSPIAFINSLYPDEGSLTDLDKFIAVLKRQASC
jgi:hypothetical protein